MSPANMSTRRSPLHPGYQTGPAFLNSPRTPGGAISISALAYRTPLHKLVADYGAIRELVDSATGGPRG